ncbi:hypothetical protein EHS17_14415 [Rhodobacteraceae bacterium CH30]|nr:hypothetical protein EHS17_14415 [Rhodobacteraceae bacterium CH30]
MLGRAGHWPVIWLWPWSSLAWAWIRLLPVAGVDGAIACGARAGGLAVPLAVTSVGAGKWAVALAARACFMVLQGVVVTDW